MSETQLKFGKGIKVMKKEKKLKFDYIGVQKLQKLVYSSEVNIILISGSLPQSW